MSNRSTKTLQNIIGELDSLSNTDLDTLWDIVGNCIEDRARKDLELRVDCSEE